MAPVSAKRDDTSVISGRSMRRIAADGDAKWESGGVVQSPPPKKRTPRQSHLRGGFMIDGEVAALDAEGRPSFQLLQNSRGGN